MNPEYIVELEPDLFLESVEKLPIMTDSRSRAKRYKTRRAARADCDKSRRLFPYKFRGAWVVLAEPVEKVKDCPHLDCPYFDNRCAGGNFQCTEEQVMEEYE